LVFPELLAIVPPVPARPNVGDDPLRDVRESRRPAAAPLPLPPPPPPPPPPRSPRFAKTDDDPAADIGGVARRDDDDDVDDEDDDDDDDDDVEDSEDTVEPRSGDCPGAESRERATA
jgi:hypothetical protein